MRKKILISFFILCLFILGTLSSFFVYPERTQNFIMETLNFKTYLNAKVKNFISRKINDENINVNIETINFLKPDWHNIAKLELKNVNIYSVKQKKKSKIRFIEFGFTFDELLKNFFLNDNDIQFSYINFQDLSLNARIEKDKFLPGPLIKIFSLIDQNNFQVQPSLKKILQGEIVIGKINLLLVNKINLLKEEILEIKCENVLISKRIHKSRSLYMDCGKGKDSVFSIKADLAKDLNNFSGKIKNINSDLLVNNLLHGNFNFLNINFNSQLNGSYNIKTNKDLSIKSFNFLSEKSILISNNNKDEEILKTKVSGVLSWKKKDNLLKFSDLLIGDQLVAFGEFDLKSKTGSSNFFIKKILVQDTKIYLNKYFDLYSFPFDLNFNEISSKLKGGKLKNLSINVKFSLFKKFIIEEIIGLSNFSNIRFDHKDRFFEKFLCTISGNLEFRLNPQKFDESLLNLNLSASDGFILTNNNKFRYGFSEAIIKGQYHNKNLIISQADFSNNNQKYSFHDVRVSKDTVNILRVEHIKEKNLQYVFSDTTINNLNITKSFLKIKNNPELSNIIKSKFDIEFIGNTDLDFFLSGNIKNLNFNLKLNADLKNSYFKIHYLDLIKNKNITSRIRSEISLIEGKIDFLKNTNLNVEDKIYKIDLIHFNNKNKNKVSLINLQTPNHNIDKIVLSNNRENLHIEAAGKKIDLSNLNKNFKSKNKDFILDLTSDLIKLNSKIFLTGNLKGEIRGSSFKSTAYGKILLGRASLLDNGKFEIYVDNNISRLEGIGLVGGAETKIILQKNINNFPSLVFETSDGGKLLNALGFTQNIKSGDMKINIDFLNEEYDHYEGRIKSKKFSLINAPGIINSLSVLSFSGIGSIISGEGVFFDRGQVNINVKNNIFNFDKLYLSSESLGITAKGMLNLEKKLIDMKGSIAPIKLISKILSVVPAVGELLTGLKKEGIFAGQFKMEGLIENPKIKLNTMSFAPGILRDLFSEDWLDNKKFFLGRNLD